MTTVLVIGGGIAGYVAALAARRDGAEVTVVARAPGATALYAGGMEVMDDLDAVLRQQPHHPITRLGLDSVRLSTELDSAIQSLRLALEKEGLKFEGSWRTRGLYADIHGLARPANLVPDSVAGGELRALSGKRVVVVGVKEVGDFDAASTAQALKELHGVEAFPEEVSIPDLPQAAALTAGDGRSIGVDRLSARVHQSARRRLRAPCSAAVATRLEAAAGDRAQHRHGNCHVGRSFARPPDLGEGR
jgi:anaerobic glycerol-3-phosphate dehydrogenase